MQEIFSAATTISHPVTLFILWIGNCPHEILTPYPPLCQPPASTIPPPVFIMLTIQNALLIFFNHQIILLLFSHSLSDSLGLHGLQHSSLPCPSLSPGACSNSCPLSQKWHPTISSSVIPFSSCLQSFPAWGSFLISQLFTSGSQSTRASASASVLPVIFKIYFL